MVTNTQNISQPSCQPATFLYCEGVGCVLRERCQRFTVGQRIGRHTTGYNWMLNCNEEERPYYLPTSK